MKKILLSAVLIFSSVLVNAQVMYGYILENTKWDMDNLEFNKVFKNLSKETKLSNDKKGNILLYNFDNIKIGNENNIKGDIYFDSITKNISYINLSFNNISDENINKDYRTFSENTSKELINFFGKPDVQDIDNDRIRLKWYQNDLFIEYYIFKVSKSFFFDLKIKKRNKSSKDFKDYSWGDNYNFIKNKEGKENLSTNNEYYAINSEVSGLKCYTAFRFIDNKLVSARYIFTENFLNKNQYIDEYERLRHLLTTKYGNPVESNFSVNWKNKRYINSKEDYGLALFLGHLSYYNYWHKDENTDVSISLGSEDNEIKFIIKYESKKYENKINESDLNKSTKDL